MKIIVYDPLYSNMGHFFRYNKYILTLLADTPSIREIVYISNEGEGESYEAISPKIQCVYGISRIQSSQIKSFNSHGFGKLKLYVNMLLRYFRVIKYINESSCELCLFTSNGLLPFWLASNIKLRKKYIVSVISLKWIYDKYSTKHFLYLAYRKFLRRSVSALVTEECYKGILTAHQVNHISVLHDRFLRTKESLPLIDADVNGDPRIRLITLGTLSNMKNPLGFIKQLKALPEGAQAGLSYDIYGKSWDGTGDILKYLIHQDANIHYYDQYISDSEYQKLMIDADFMVIPYDGLYTKFMTSGVMWDSFEYRKPIICPDVEPFRHYISTYHIGFIYTPDSLGDVIEKLQQNKEDIRLMMQRNYEKLYEVQSYQNTLDPFVRLMIKSAH